MSDDTQTPTMGDDRTETVEWTMDELVAMHDVIVKVVDNIDLRTDAAVNPLLVKWPKSIHLLPAEAAVLRRLFNEVPPTNRQFWRLTDPGGK